MTLPICLHSLEDCDEGRVVVDLHPEVVGGQQDAFPPDRLKQTNVNQDQLQMRLETI